MAKILMLTHVKHEGQEFYKDELRIVPDMLAGYFCGNGWAEDTAKKIATGPADTAEKTLDVQNGQHGHNTWSE